MRKLLYILPGLCFLASWSVAETIESVTFNPARLGRYESLKVSDKLTSKGGINAQSVTVQSGGTVSVENPANYQADTVDVVGKISMPSTRFVSPELKSQGKAAFVDKSSDVSSEIEKLNSVARVKGNVLKLGTVTVTGANTTDYDDDSVSGLTLGGNNIPVADASCANLSWISRVDDDGTAYKVLGFASCSGDDEDDCTTSYGKWLQDSTGKKTDTCNGNRNTSFSCVYATKDKVTTCVDVRKVSTSGGEDTVENLQQTTSDAVDTCDGDAINMYAGVYPKTGCRDVWVETAGSTFSGQPNTNTGGNLCKTECSLNANMYDQNKSAYDMILEVGINTFCRDYITHGYYGTSCSACASTDSGLISQNPPSLDGNNGGMTGPSTGMGGSSGGRKDYPYHCEVKYYERTLYGGSGAEESYEYRNITCCGDEGKLTEIPGGSVSVGGGSISKVGS